MSDIHRTKPFNKRKNNNNRKIIPTFNEKKNRPYMINEDGVDMTPQPLRDTEYETMVHATILEKTHFFRIVSNHLEEIRKIRSGFESTTDVSSVIDRTTRGSRFTLHGHARFTQQMSMMKESAVSVETVSADFASRLTTAGLSYESEEILLDEKPPSMFILREDPPPRYPQLQLNFKISLQETETINLLDIVSKTEFAKETDQNEIDRFAITSFSQATTQTDRSANIGKNKYTLILRGKRQNSAAFVTKFDIYDTYIEIDSRKNVDEENVVDSLTTVKDDKENEMFDKISFLGMNLGKKFFYSTLVIERIIVANEFKKNQYLYQGLCQLNPLSVQIDFNYSLKLLWTYQDECTKNKAVTSISLSPNNDNIIAVGYGKYKFTDCVIGFVCCWNIKNPSCPERSYKFDEPVTCVSFSKQRPNILAVSFYSGLLVLLDVTKVFERVMASNMMYPLFHPIRKICWFPNEEKNKNDYTVTCGKDGKIFQYTKAESFTSKLILSLTRTDGKIQGSEQTKKCFANKVLISRHPSAECIARHPIDQNIYYTGSSEGNVYRCSIYFRFHLEVFAAHNGPVYGIEFHPFCTKLFLTFGADGFIKAWADGIYEPIFSLTSGMKAVGNAMWHPTNATMIVSTTDRYIEMWDIRHSALQPQSSIISPSNSINTCLKFTNNGYNVCVGDYKGNVHILALSEMPFSPINQPETLVQAIYLLLRRKPYLISKLKMLGPPFLESRDQALKIFSDIEELKKIV
uniref:Dynein axonemal intermediate chain 4 n=1 Tax=Clastoptera arizonana TaxID=38151 RepID=A0A1B6EAA7_9HEMI